MDQEPLQLHGGRRAGAGRPPTLTKQLSEAKALARKLQAATRTGLRALANHYEELMERAIERALNGNDKLLVTLIELLPKTVRLEGDEEKPIAQLWQQFKVDVTVTAKDDKQAIIVEGEKSGEQ